jgi:MFS family permease
MKWLKLKSFSELEIKQSFELLRQYDTDASCHTRKDDAREDGQRINIIKCIHGLQRANHHSKVTSSADDKRLRILRLLIGKDYMTAASITNQSSMAIKPLASSTPSTNTDIATRELGSDDDNDNDDDNIYPLSYEQYKEKIVRIGETLDIRIWNIGLSFLFAGASVGIIVPCMPLLVSQLSIPPNEFGYIVSAFGLSKLLGNIPAGYLVDTYGRKPVMVAGLGMCAIGMGSIGFALMPGLGTPWLISCRLVSGLGVSAFVAGGFMYMSDISNTLNRTRTIAPVMAAFSAGAALGPAVGGLLVDTIGIPPTYGIVGGLFVLLAAVNSRLLEETKAQVLFSSDSSEGLLHDDSSVEDKERERDRDKDRGILGSFHTAYSSWYELINSANRQISNVVVLNGLYWFTLSGTQMTLLPLVMIDPHFGLQMSAYEIGGCFAFMSIISFASSQPLAYLSDKYGKVPLMLIGCTMLSGSMFSLPLLASMGSTSMDLLPILLPFALGSTIMNSNPNALMANETTSESRSQGLSLLRTSGDLGLLLGSTASGAFALMTSIESALQMNGLVTSATIIWFTSRNWKHLSFKI